MYMSFEATKTCGGLSGIKTVRFVDENSKRRKCKARVGRSQIYM